MHIAHGWLELDPGDTQVLIKVPSKRMTALATATGFPRGVVSHWSADPIDERGHGDSVWLAKSIEERPKPGKPGASWHVIIDRNGTMVQSVSFLQGSWHVGKPGVVEGFQMSNINQGTAGIELENAGPLLPHAGQFYAWPYWKQDPETKEPNHSLGPDPRFLIPVARRRELPQTAVWAPGGKKLVFPAGVWETYTLEQERAFELLVRALVAAYALPETAFRYGHAHFVPLTFKQDPGPVWLGEVLPRILARVFPTT